MDISPGYFVRCLGNGFARLKAPQTRRFSSSQRVYMYVSYYHRILSYVMPCHTQFPFVTLTEARYKFPQKRDLRSTSRELKVKDGTLTCPLHCNILLVIPLCTCLFQTRRHYCYNTLRYYHYNILLLYYSTAIFILLLYYSASI